MENNQPIPPTNDSIRDTIKNLWAKYSIFFIIFLVLGIAAKASSFIMDMIAASSKKDVEKAKTEDSKLKSQEDSLNKQADDLVKQANDLPSQEGKVDQDWNKK